MSLNINFTLWSTHIAGGNRVIFEVANRLCERGHSVTITAIGFAHDWFPLRPKVRYFLPQILRKIGSIYTSSFRVRKSDLNPIDFFLMRCLKNTIPECDVNIATFYPTSYAVLWSKKGIPFYYVQHLETLFPTSTLSKKIARLSYSLPMKKIVVSKWLREELTKICGEEPFYVPNGVDREVFYPRRVYKNTSKLAILAFLRGIEWKGDKDLLLAIKKLPKQYLNKIRLILLGERRVFWQLTKAIKLKIEFELFSKVSDTKLAELYSTADIFVSTSWIEGFSLPPLEAMSCGCPVVVTDSLGIRDYAKDGYNSIVVEPKRPDELSEAIVFLLENESVRKELGRNGMRTAKKFDWERSVDKLEGILMS